MTTPTGLPYWARTTSAEFYGGILGKEDYQTPGVINARTDVSAAQFLRLCADLAGVARVAPVGMAQWLCNDSAPAAPTIQAAACGATRSSSSYAGDAAPSGLPSATRLGNGSIRLVFPVTSEDDFQVSAAIQPSVWIPTLQNSAGFVLVSQFAARTFDVSAVNSGGSALSNPTVSIVIF